MDIDNLNDFPKEKVRQSPPSVYTTTSPGKYHFYYFLDNPVNLDNPLELEQTNKALERALGGDNCSNADRVLRLPGTRNLKNGYLVNWVPSRENPYTLEQLRSLYPLSVNGSGHSSQCMDQGVNNGQRNITLTSLIGIWHNEGLSKQDIVEKASLWNDKNIPPLTAKELFTTINSVLSTIRSKLAHYTFSERLSKVSHIKKEKEIKLNSGIVLRGVTTVQGSPGIGKSMFALNVLKLAVNRGLSVCYIDYENGPRRIEKRLTALGMPSSDFSRFFYSSKYDKEIVNNTQDLVILDSIQKLDRDNPVQGLERYLGEIEDIANSQNKMFLLISEKQAAAYNLHYLGSGRYSSRISYTSSFVYDMIQKQEKGLEIRCEKDRDGEGILYRNWVYQINNCRLELVN